MMSAVADATLRPDESRATAERPLLEVRNLKMHFTLADGVLSRKTASKIKAVDDISFTIARGETLGLVGESGCGKTTTGRCILHLEKPTAGEIIFEGQNLTNLDRKALN